MALRRAVHPLLLDPCYWRARLDSIDVEPVGVVWTPRPDLSGRGLEVMEFRIRAHDGDRLWGLFARPAWQSEPWPAIVRSVGPADRPSITSRLVQSGTAEFVFQEPAGRRLADRVVDVMQVCRLALETSGIEDVEVEAPEQDVEGRQGGSGSDELLIADQLMSRRIVRPVEPDQA